MLVETVVLELVVAAVVVEIVEEAVVLVGCSPVQASCPLKVIPVMDGFTSPGNVI